MGTCGRHESVDSGLRTPEDLISVMGIPFSDEQLEAITAPMAPGVIIAGAGTGKTTVMAARVVWLVGRGEISPQRVLGLTFTKKAAGELSSRVRSALRLLDEEQESYPDIFTYDSFASRLVTEFGAWQGISGQMRILTDAEKYLLADQVVTSSEEAPRFLVDKALSTIDKDVLELEGRIQSHLVTDQAILEDATSFLEALDRAPLWRGTPYRSVADAAQTVWERLDLLHFCQRYREVKAQQCLVDFSDQMAMAVELAGSVPQMGATLRARYGLVVVDEFQDTSAAQAQLLSRLFGVGAGINQYPITAVGDPLQAIYTWRGAAVDNIYSFQRFFGPAKTYTLSINRRSGPEILAAANEISRPVRADPLLGEQMAVELVAGSGPLPADVDVREFLTWDEETEWIADSLLDAHRIGQIPAWENAAILVRRNREVGALYEACRGRGIPVAIQDLGGLLSLEAISQVYAMMKVLTDDTSNPEVIEILSGPRFRLGLEDMASLGRRARELAHQNTDSATEPRLIEAVKDPGDAWFSPHARSSLARLASAIGALTAYQGNLEDHVWRIVSQIGLDVEVHATQREAALHLRSFLAHVAEFSATHPDASLTALVAYLRAEEDHAIGLSKANPSQVDAVQIITIHRAKGLEWDLVYLPCVVEGVFPNERVTDNPLTSPAALPTAVRSDATAVPQIREVTNKGLAAYKEELKQALGLAEDRLAYVGVTRAKRRLVVTAHVWGDSTRARTRSRYVETLARAGVGTVTLIDDEDRGPGKGGERGTLVQMPWPTTDDPKWQEAAQAVLAAIDGRTTWQAGDLPEEVTDQIASWDDLIETVARRAPQVVDVPVPTPLPTSQLIRLVDDHEQYAARLARPLPRKPSRQAGIGSQFHAWVEQFYAASPLIDTAEAPTGELGRLTRGFLTSPFASMRPCAVEEEFLTTIDGHTVSGRIDAVFRAEENPSLVPQGKRVLIVDWKTGNRKGDPHQLAVYAQGWAAKAGIDPGEVAAGFFYVLRGEFVEVNLTMFPIHVILTEDN